MFLCRYNFLEVSLVLRLLSKNSSAVFNISSSLKISFAPASISNSKYSFNLYFGKSSSIFKSKYSLKEWEDKLALALVNAGVDAKKQLSLYRQYVSPAKRKTINQYKTFKLEVYTAEEAQNVMNELVKNEISSGRLTKVWLSSRDAVADSLKVEAIKMAKHDAMAISGISCVVAGGLAIIASIPTIYVGYGKVNRAIEMYNISQTTQPQAYWNIQGSQNGIGLALNF